MGLGFQSARYWTVGFCLSTVKNLYSYPLYLYLSFIKNIMILFKRVVITKGWFLDPKRELELDGSKSLVFMLCKLSMAFYCFLCAFDCFIFKQ